MKIKKYTSVFLIAVVSAALAAGTCQLYLNSRTPLSLMQDAAGADSMSVMTLNTILQQMMMNTGARGNAQAESGRKEKNCRGMICYFLILLNSLLLADPSLRRMIIRLLCTFSRFLSKLLRQYHFKLLRPPDIVYSILCRLFFIDPVRKSISILTVHSGNNPLGKPFPRDMVFPEPALLSLHRCGFFL